MQAARSAPALEVQQLGAGPRVVFVHGSVLGTRTWERQRGLAARWRLVLAHRPGFGSSPPLARGDFEAEAPLFAALLGQGAHLVGHSYGAVIALYAAALRPESVRSLTVSEPGCLAVAGGAAAVDRQIAAGRLLYEQAGRLAPADFLRAFRAGTGSLRSTPGELAGELLRGAELLMRERPPWEAEPPLQELANAPFAKLVLSGGHSPVFETVCDTLAGVLGAQREVLAGRAHSVPAVGAAYNERLERFMAAAERGA